jgi:hypothetical protein
MMILLMEMMFGCLDDWQCLDFCMHCAAHFGFYSVFSSWLIVLVLVTFLIGSGIGILVIPLGLDTPCIFVRMGGILWNEMFCMR